MIEFALLQNGGTSVPIKPSPNGSLSVPDADLAEMHLAVHDTLRRQVAHSVVAEEAGFHYTFFTEHHNQPEGTEFSPNPVATGIAVAMVTERIRIGQLVNILPGHHPLRLAEEVATLDVLSGGRAEMGWGRGIQPREWESFGQSYGSTLQDEARNRAYVEECYEIILKAWTEPSFFHQGQFFTIPPVWTTWGVADRRSMTEEYFSQAGIGRTAEQVVDRQDGGAPMLREISVLPQPFQKPYPQGWSATQSARSLDFAASRGLNAFFSVGDAETIKRDLERYYKAAEAHDWPDRLDRGQFKYGWDCEKRRGLSHLRCVHIHDKDVGNEEAFQRGARHFSNYFDGLVGDSPFLPKGVSFHDGLLEPAMVHGTRDEVIEQFLRLKEISGEGDFLALSWFDVPGLSEAEHEEQLRCFGEDIMPVLERECGGAPEREVAERTLRRPTSAVNAS